MRLGIKAALKCALYDRLGPSLRKFAKARYLPLKFEQNSKIAKEKKSLGRFQTRIMYALGTLMQCHRLLSNPASYRKRV